MNYNPDSGGLMYPPFAFGQSSSAGNFLVPQNPSTCSQPDQYDFPSITAAEAMLSLGNGSGTMPYGTPQSGYNNTMQSTMSTGPPYGYNVQQTSSIGQFPSLSATTYESTTRLPITPPGSPHDAKYYTQASCRTPEKSYTRYSSLVCSPPSHVTINATNSNDTSKNGVKNLNESSDFLPNPIVNDAQLPTKLDTANTSVMEPTSTRLLQSSPNPLLARVIHQSQRPRSRSSKKPIPPELKDNKYFERRQRNNAAAKKSRDQKKYREDDVAMRAASLERENSYLHAQIAQLKEEADLLRQKFADKCQIEAFQSTGHVIPTRFS